MEFNNKQEKGIKRLACEHRFNCYTARAYLRYDGRCAYCGVDLLKDPLSYAAGTIDHLLPRTKYPDYIEHMDNYTLCCTSCNSIKGAMDVLLPEEDPKSMLEDDEKKKKLIERVQAEIQAQREKNEEIRRSVCAIVYEANRKE
ncbi:MAG TPA: HNH endonuclease signature motif containing protein [Bacillota bacterium]|nr:HNH endonuclease signature motif containing protein [Bacillota bacterium]